ncbi:arsenic resistance N-acetyltransferase ArsN2 [Aminobacter sp. BA135]|uniref:arsenic resistance N-acetyltransferase ArsN2 n=1 Tax=Aminobacter sp. BA135 TaxID=537596 RepID=UPI003D7BCDB1
MNSTIQQIEPGDAEFVAALAAEHLPADDLAEDGRLFFRLQDNGMTVGFGGLEVVGDHALLRSIVVLPPARGQGAGKHITEQLLRKAEDLGISEVYLLTTSAAPFFEAAGFERVGRDTAPSKILATRQASSLCPSSAALLMRRLPLLRPCSISETTDD